VDLPLTGPARLVRVPLDGALEAPYAALLVAGDTRPFALSGAWAGGGAIAGSEPVAVAPGTADPFALLELQPDVSSAEDGAVGGGWFGFLGFGLGQRVERLAAAPPRPTPLPEFALAFHDHVLRCDAAGEWWFEALWTDARDEALRERLAVLRGRLAGAPAPQPFTTAPWRSTPSADGHAAAVAACRERIAQGDLFQANVTLRLSSRLDGRLADLHAVAAADLQPDRAAFVAGPWGGLASLSPELFLRRHGRDVLSAPIKGTAPRTEDPAALASSEKDRAENVMIVDLVRNDLGRVCMPGTIRVETLAAARPHAGVWHLVSEVAGRLREDAGDAALLRATFPPGSVTGAPKVAALDVISELESTGREAYCGALGFASPLAGLELSVAIRTFEQRGDDLWLGAGGGVVADSDPAAEAAEAATKAAPLLAAIGGARAEVRAAVPQGPLRLAPRPVARPRPAAGVFTTVLALDGTAHQLGAHIGRLARSVRELYGVPLPRHAAGLLVDAAAVRPSGARLRLTARPGADGGIELELDAGRLPDTGGPPPDLAPVCIPGGLGEHKWRDRALLDALSGHVAPALALIVDLDGLVLETSRSNVFVVVDGALVTPPADGRILRGVTRAAVLEAAHRLGIEHREDHLPLPVLADADEVFLTGALRGIEPIRGGEVALALAAELEAAAAAATAVSFP
jgi:para-aminobenzoate synthetase/4-amino-4-deoxychorismate lyase